MNPRQEGWRRPKCGALPVTVHFAHTKVTVGGLRCCTAFGQGQARGHSRTLPRFFSGLKTFGLFYRVTRTTMI